MSITVLQLWKRHSVYEKTLILLFFFSLPFVQPRVRWDGIGYYAYLRSPLIDHNFRFASDWNSRPEKMFLICKACPPEAKEYWNNPANELLLVFLDGHFYVNPITKTGHLPNFYSVGPAILWSPFVSAAHLAVLASDLLGANIPADGHSWPYTVALSASTAFYGFLGLYLSFQLAKRYLEEKWAFWATLGIWFASSLPVYMYLNPSWSHAHSAFCVALLFWYWDRTRASRTWPQWIVLGLISGFMLDVYLANGIFLLAPVLDCLAAYSKHRHEPRLLWKDLQVHLLFAASVIVAFSPMLITREIVYGNPFTLGMYANVAWNWKSPAFRAVLFSSHHGIFVWTPILLLSVLGLFALLRLEPSVGRVCLLVTLAFYCLISFDPWWYGTLSFGNRFFVSLTPVFIMGLTAAFSYLARFWADSRAAARRVVPITALFILWNFGLIYQWSAHLLPTPGVISWSEVVYNQFRVVPVQALHNLSAKLHGAHSSKDSKQVVTL